MVANLQQLNYIEQRVSAIGQRHITYGTKPEDYQTICKVLIWTLDEVLGNRWDEDTKQAWIEVHTILVNAKKKRPSVPVPF